jgi:hypothetical protein
MQMRKRANQTMTSFFVKLMPAALFWGVLSITLSLNDLQAQIAPTRAWSRVVGSGTDDRKIHGKGQGVCLDNLGNVYICGDTYGSFDSQTNTKPGAVSPDMCLTKFNPEGTKLWTRIWGASGWDYGQSVAADNLGAVYVAGYTDGSFDGQTNKGSLDFCLSKFDSDGIRQWSRIWGTINAEWGEAVCTDGTNSVYVAGHISNTPIILHLSKFASDGTPLWTQSWGAGQQSLEYAEGVCVDSSNNVYVVGNTDRAFDGQTNAGDWDIYLTKFNSAGNKVWSRIWGSSATEYGTGVSVDGSNFIYAVGTTQGSWAGETNDGSFRMCLSKYDPNGNHIWSRIWGSGWGESGGRVAADGLGNTYVSGVSLANFDGQTNPGYYSPFLTKYDANGNRKWSRMWGSSGYDISYGVGTDGSGSVAVMGDTSGTSFDGQTINGGFDLFVTKWFDNDTDNDTLPDGWEFSLFGGIARDGNGDYDLDGSLDWQEYIAGTSPTNPVSALRIDEFTTGSTNITLNWPSVTGRLYKVMTATNLVSPLTNKVFQASGNGSQLAYTNAEVLDHQRFFGITVELEP